VFSPAHGDKRHFVELDGDEGQPSLRRLSTSKSIRRKAQPAQLLACGKECSTRIFCHHVDSK
jgi:hypothetical protein